MGTGYSDLSWHDVRDMPPPELAELVGVSQQTPLYLFVQDSGRLLADKLVILSA